ncbi:MAG: PstS family phosphate ABC transporter substrate-binding protein [Anaerolineae bacterium]|nr:PstS family phosphate ABC transporter substrate-binding protein [Anaerolineae bacterium]NUQ03139.1 PstS family phosphate ABC transporter substrate-binding protein [Anaerolineae bacterium]
MLKRLFWIVAAIVLVLPIAIMAQETEVELPEVDPLSVSGDIIVAGSSTVYPLTEAVAEQFIADGFSGEITIDSIGSGGGFERFCVAGETDIANASRGIKDSEIESCGALTPARTPIEIRVGTDALAVVVSAENDFVETLTIEQLAKIYSGEFATWADVDATYPAEAIQLFSPGTDSGTFDFFVEAVMQPGLGAEAEDAETAIINAPGIQTSEDDNVLVQGVEGSPYAIAYFGFAYFSEEADSLKALGIDAGDGVSFPNAESAEDGSYPLARPLFIYTDAGIMAEKPQVAAYVVYYLTVVNDLIGEVGYFPASDEALNAAKTAVSEALGM